MIDQDIQRPSAYMHMLAQIAVGLFYQFVPEEFQLHLVIGA
jgi:hypothetical protein